MDLAYRSYQSRQFTIRPHAITVLTLCSSPRWLVENGQVAEAATVLCWLREGSFTHNEVDKEVSDMVESVEEHRHSGLSWKSLFIEPPLFARMWRAALLHFLAQMCGAAAMKYYLPTLLKALGLSRRLALMAGAIEMTLKVGCSVIEMLIIDRLGRRLSLIIGCLAMALGMLVSSGEHVERSGRLRMACSFGEGTYGLCILGQRCIATHVPGKQEPDRGRHLHILHIYLRIRI